MDKESMDVTKLTLKDRCYFSVKLAKRAASYLQGNGYEELIEKALNTSQEWIEEMPDITGDLLYDLLDNEEDGISLLQETEEDAQKIYAWNCIIDAVAYISRAAYEKEGSIYFPEPIELVDDNIFEHMTDSLIMCNSMEEAYIKEVYQEYL